MLQCGFKGDIMKKIIIVLLTAIVVAGGVFAFSRESTKDSKTTVSTISSNSSNSANDSSSNQSNDDYVIHYDINGFEPSAITVKSGSYITIKNGEEVEVASDPHPTHTENIELNLGVIRSNESKTFRLTKKGTFGYHNHLNPSQKGSITVE
jgi:plastocyanin